MGAGFPPKAERPRNRAWTGIWDIFVDDLVEELKRGLPEGSVEVVVYADDVTVLLRGARLDELYKRAQHVLDRLSQWEIRNDARVSLDKATVTVFTTKPTPLSAKQRPKLFYQDQAAPPPFKGVQKLIQYAAHPKLLGLVYDERLTFQAHISGLRPKLQARRRTVDTLSGTKWGCNHRTLRSLHLSYVQAKPDYGLAAYGPFATEEAMKALCTEQYQAACRLSGCPEGTRREVALLEAGLASMTQRVDYCTAMQYERCRRLPDGNRARMAAELEGPPAPKRRSMRTRARRVTQDAGLDNQVREPLATHSSIPPWATCDGIDFRPALARKVSKKRDAPEACKAAAEETLALLPHANIEAYTDGSVLDPRALRRGGGGYTLVDANGALHRGMCAAGARCNSYRAELSAMIKCLDDLIEGEDDTGAKIAYPEGGCEVRIALDSQSAIERLARGPSTQTGLLEMRTWERLIRLRTARRVHITVQY
eukprot:gene9449-biopygen6121